MASSRSRRVEPIARVDRGDLASATRVRQTHTDHATARGTPLESRLDEGSRSSYFGRRKRPIYESDGDGADDSRALRSRPSSARLPRARGRRGTRRRRIDDARSSEIDADRDATARRTGVAGAREARDGRESRRDSRATIERAGTASRTDFRANGGAMMTNVKDSVEDSAPEDVVAREGARGRGRESRRR